jgi:predicted flap endonuclease-1-like 5' DNA nuclease
MVFQTAPFFYYILPAFIVGLLLGWLMFRGKGRRLALEAQRRELETKLEAARAENAMLERELASARDQVKPLADELDRLRASRAPRRPAADLDDLDDRPPPPPGASVPPPRQAPVGWQPGRKLPTFMDAPIGPTDDLTLLKGVGPRLAARLREIGVFYYAQIADWSPEEVKLVDAKLDTFRGRIERDQLIEQAKLLAAGRITEYEARFGKLGS